MTRALATLAALAVALSGCPGGSGGGGWRSTSSPPPPPDVTPPNLAAQPAGGAYASFQYVTVATDEPAMIRYTLDGTDPALASTSVRSAPSPIVWVRIGTGTTVLRAVARDAAGNASTPIQETYVVTLPPVDATPPALEVLSAPGVLPLLATTTIAWRADDAVEWDAFVLASTGTMARRLAAGTAGAGEVVPVEVHGWDLSPAESRSLLVRTVNASGLPSAVEVALAPDPPVLGTTVGGAGWCYDLALAPDGRRAYFTSTGTGVAVLDTDAASATFGSVLATLPLPSGSALSAAVAPDGARVWVGASSGAGLFAMDPAGGAATVVSTVTPFVQSVAVAPGGAAVFLADEWNAVYRLDVDAVGSVTRTTALPAYTGYTGFDPDQLAVAAAGRRLFAGWTAIDVDPTGARPDGLAGYLPVSGYVASQPASAGGDGPVFAVGRTAAGSTVLQSFDPLTLTSLASTVVAESIGSFWFLGATRDGAHLLALDSDVLRVFRAADLVELGSWPLPLADPGGAVSPLRIASDGTSAWARAYGPYGPDFCRALRVPLR